jgi:hypothetical protein
MRVAKLIGARAMQTGILADWIEYGLQDPNRLKHYLTEAENTPDERFRRLCNLIVDDPALIDSIGEFKDDDSLVSSINRPTMRLLDVIGITGLPEDRLLRKQLSEIGKSFGIRPAIWIPAGDPLRQPLEILIQPTPRGSYGFNSENFDLDWCREVDIVRVLRNVSDVPMPLGPDGTYILPKSAILYLYRPDYEIPRALVCPITRLGSLLSLIDPNRASTIVAHQWLALLPATKGDPRETPTDTYRRMMDELRSWTDGRTVLLYAQGVHDDLLLQLSLLSHVFGRLVNTARSLDTRWGVVLMRPEAEASPLIVHPTVISEWSRHVPTILTWAEISMNLPTSEFWRGDPTYLAHLYRFLRIFRGEATSLQRWSLDLKQATSDVEIDRAYYNIVEDSNEEVE